jgi:drug/metabolite transporter (DMT)-like permease
MNERRKDWCIDAAFFLSPVTFLRAGLILVAASVYQMLRGAVVLFTAAFSILFLRRRLNVNNWIGLFLVVSGVTLVGLSSILFNPDASTESENAVLGVVLVIAAQMFTACQFVFEEKVWPCSLPLFKSSD